MAWGVIIAAAASYASSREQRSQNREANDASIEMLRERMRLEEERDTRDRERRQRQLQEGWNSWQDYGMGGSQAQNIWGTPANPQTGAQGTPPASINTGLLNPHTFQQTVRGSNNTIPRG